MDLIRSTLLGIEAVTGDDPYFIPVMDTTTDHHLNLLKSQGLINIVYGPDRDNELGKWYILASLTWAGHDFIDSVRDDEIWRKTKEGAKAAGGFSVDLLKALAKGFLKKQIETRTGVELDL